MEFGKTLKKALIDSDIGGTKQLAVESGVSYDIALRLLKGDKGCRLKDLIAVADKLNVEVKFITKGEE